MRKQHYICTKGVYAIKNHLMQMGEGGTASPCDAFQLLLFQKTGNHKRKRNLVAFFWEDNFLKASWTINSETCWLFNKKGSVNFLTVCLKITRYHVTWPPLSQTLIFQKGSSLNWKTSYRRNPLHNPHHRKRGHQKPPTLKQTTS